jgi:hypothetical protein
MMGMGGRYLATRLTVRPLCTITIMSPAAIFSAVLRQRRRRRRGGAGKSGGRTFELQDVASACRARGFIQSRLLLPVQPTTAVLAEQ